MANFKGRGGAEDYYVLVLKNIAIV